MSQHDQPSLTALAASFFDASEDCVKVVSLGGELLAMNANGICLMEIDDFEALRGQPWTGMWPESQRPLIDTALDQARKGAGSRFSADCPTGAGTMKSWEVVVWPVLGESGEPTQIISISRDVTERNRLEEQRQLFVRELAHRIKNTFAVVDGIIAMSARSAGEARGFAEALRKRLMGLGRAISYMAPPDFTENALDEARSLQGLLRVLLAPYGATDGADSQISISGDDLALGSEATTTLALIFNELATNAMKHGALRTAEGRVAMRLERQGGDLHVAWTESSPSGPKKDAATGKAGFGTALLERAVARQLGGRLEKVFGPEGLTVTIQIPLARITA